MPDADRLYLDLKGARERLCRAQVSVVSAHKLLLQIAIDNIDRLGVFYGPGQWSKYDEPPPPIDGSERG